MNCLFRNHLEPCLPCVYLFFNVCIFFFFFCAFVQTLLRHGANPDLRDEDGKTPLDKARERGHSEVVAILQSPG